MIPSAKEIFEAINASKNIALIAHAKPDGDTLGSVLSLAQYCKNKNLKYSVFCFDTPPSYLNHLPLINEVQKPIENFGGFDTIVFVDHGSIEQSKFAEKITPLLETRTILNIDHHISNSKFGKINFVITDRSSTCELLYLMFLQQNIEVTKEMANCLMTGLITDTGHFMNSATNITSLEIAGDLVRKGAKIPNIGDQVINNKSIPSLNIWGKILERITIDPKDGHAYTVITADDLATPGLDKESLDGLVNFMTGIQDVPYVKLMIQDGPKQVKISLRTLRDDIDLSAMAAVYGGGGHKKASGYKVPGKIVLVNNIWQII